MQTLQQHADLAWLSMKLAKIDKFDKCANFAKLAKFVKYEIITYTLPKY